MRWLEFLPALRVVGGAVNVGVDKGFVHLAVKGHAVTLLVGIMSAGWLQSWFLLVDWGEAEGYRLVVVIAGYLYVHVAFRGGRKLDGVSGCAVGGGSYLASLYVQVGCEIVRVDNLDEPLTRWWADTRPSRTGPRVVVFQPLVRVTV